MKVNLKTKEYCENCPKFIPNISQTELYADEKIYARGIFIQCSNQELCESIKAFLEEQVEGR